MYDEWMEGCPLYCGIKEFDDAQDARAAKYYEEKGDYEIAKRYRENIRMRR